MDDERWEPGMAVLDRQGVPDGRPGRAGTGASVAGAAVAGAAVVGPAVDGPRPSPTVPTIRPGEEHLPESLRGLPVRSVPETKPTPLQKHFVLLSAPALILGAIAITALELGAGFDSALVKLCVLLAAPLLLVTTADATLRIWRSAWAWMPVDRNRGLFRLAWVVCAIVFLALIVGAVVLVLGA
jgi:hypothetical protein